MTSSTVKSKNTDNKNTFKKTSEIPKTLGFFIVFVGVFFLVASLFSLITLLVLRATSGDSDTLSTEEIYATMLTVTTILSTLASIFIGFKLIKELDIGRKLFNIFTIVIIALSLGKYAYQISEITKSYANMPVELAASAKQIELDSALTVFILPAILVFVVILLNLKRSKASLKQ